MAKKKVRFEETYSVCWTNENRSYIEYEDEGLTYDKACAKAREVASEGKHGYVIGVYTMFTPDSAPVTETTIVEDC